MRKWYPAVVGTAMVTESQLRSFPLRRRPSLSDPVIPAPSPSVSLTLIPSPAAPSLAPSTSPLCSDAVAPPFRRHRRPNNRRVSFSHLISSMWFLGCLCVLEKWVVGFAYFLFLIFFFFFFFLGVMLSWDFLSRNDEHSQFYWTRFLYIEIEFNKLNFCVQKPSLWVNRVRWTRIVKNAISLKRCLTYNIVCVL